MQLHHRHEWNIPADQAIALQKQLAAEIIANRPLDWNTIKLVAGVDVSVKDDPVTQEPLSQAAVVVLTYPDLQPIETVRSQMPTPFPYIPGLLTFREGPVLVQAFEQLQHTPDVFVFDGMGIAHPRRIGIAAHMGLWLQLPTIGCGKTLLIGQYTEPDAKKGAASDLIDKGQLIGKVLRTRDNVKPVYISPGHLADIPTSVELVLRSTTQYRLPEPIRFAHNAAGQFS